MGTHWGIVHILDLNGNDVKRFECHSATVNELSIDSNGEYIASASDDGCMHFENSHDRLICFFSFFFFFFLGKIVINSLYSSEQINQKYRRPMKAIALEPDYSRKTTRHFVLGGTSEELMMSGKGWFGGNKDVIIHSGEGPIYTIKWRLNYIAWANEAVQLIFKFALHNLTCIFCIGC